MFTPVMILKMWNKVNNKYGLAEDDPKAKDKEKDKKPSSKGKQAEKEDKRVEKRLTELRLMGKGDLKEPKAGKRFLNSRDKAAKAMKKYCKLLKSNDLKESVQDLTNFRKAVKQLVVVVESLEAKPYPENAEGEPDMAAFGKIDTSALDKLMEDPKFGEYSDAELDQDEAEDAEAHEAAPPAKEGGPGSIPPPKQKPAEDLAAKFKDKMKELMPRQLAALKTGPANKPQLELAMKLAMAAAKNLEYEQGLVQLKNLEDELAKAQPKPADDLAAKFKEKMKELMPKYQTVLPTGPANKAPLELAMKLAMAAAKDLAYAEGLVQLKKLEDELAKAQPKPDKDEDEDETPKTNMGIWNKAKDKVSLEIDRLCVYLRKTKEEALLEAARRLDAAVDKVLVNVSWNSALMNFDNADGAQQKQLLPKLTEILEAFKTRLAADTALATADENPLVPVNTKQPLLAALDQIQKNLQA